MFKQKTNLVIKVTGMEKKVIEKEEGAIQYTILETKGKIMPEGSLITVSKFVNTSRGKAVAPFMTDEIEKFEGFVEDFDTATGRDLAYYVNTYVSPSKDKKDPKKLIQWSKISHDVLDDGREYLKIDALVKPLAVLDGKEGDIVVFEYQNGGTKEVAVADLDTPTIEATMIALSYDSNTGRMELTSGGDYPVNLVVYQDMTKKSKGSPAIGKGYNFLLAVEKGQLIKAEDSVEEELAWGEEKEVVAKNTFSPDKLTILSVGLAKGYVLDGVADASVDPLDDMMKDFE